MNYFIKNPNPALQFKRVPTKRTKTTGIIIHHYHHSTATPQVVNRWHRDDNGWLGIGYNLIVDMDGTIWEGRGIEAVGAHAANHNNNNIGIACQGRYDDNDKKMPDAQFNALVWLIKHLHVIYGNLPIIAHREVGVTSCPGKYFPFEELKRLNERGGTDDVTRMISPDVMDSHDDLQQFKDIKYFDTLISNAAAPGMLDIKIDNGISDVETALTVLFDAGIVNTPDYWRDVMKMIVGVDAVLIKMANRVRNIFERIIHAEARGEPFEGQIAVGNVIMNRHKSSGFPNGIHNVVFQTKLAVQFTPTVDGGYRAAMNISRSVRLAVDDVLCGMDNSKGALYFCTRESAARGNWHERSLTFLFELGNHRFYK